MYLSGDLPSDHSNEVCITRIVVLGARAEEYVTADCLHCRGPKPQSFEANGTRLTFTRVKLILTRSSRLFTDVLAPNTIGRYKSMHLFRWNELHAFRPAPVAPRTRGVTGEARVASGI
jgi:hypothetical protein